MHITVQVDWTVSKDFDIDAKSQERPYRRLATRYTMERYAC